ncbi:hypothetical protein Taro_013850, partial [Colocasia esculenta]|nr:hypothetical protein [Colocasia esculenta]
MVLVVLPRLFARCLALEGLSLSEVVSISWDPHPREPVEGGIRATSVLELAAHLRGKRGLDSGAESFVELSCLRLGCRGVRSAFLAHTRQSLVSLPLSALVPEPRSGVRREAAASPGCGVACVVCFYGGSVSPFAGVEAGARLASKARGLRVPLLAASGSGLVAVVVTLHGGYSLAVPSSCGRRWSGLGQTRASGGSRFSVLSVPWSHSWVPARDGTGVCCFPTWRCVRGSGVVLLVGPRPCRGLRWPCLRYDEHCFRFVPDSVGFCGSRVWDAEGFGVLSWCRPDSPLSHCLSLRWFWSHVVVSGVRPQLGQAAVLRVLCVSVAALSRPSWGCAEHCFRFVPNFVGFCGSRVCATTMIARNRTKSPDPKRQSFRFAQ